MVMGSIRSYQLDQSLPLFKSVFGNALLEHGGLPHALPLSVHLSTLRGTQLLRAVI